MNKEWNKLVEKHKPLLDEYKSAPVGKGWWILIDSACSLMEDKEMKPEGFTQIKEKFGGLRFYFGVSNLKDKSWPKMDQFIGSIEYMSWFICEDCGSHDNVTTEGNWKKTLCKNCRKVREN